MAKYRKKPVVIDAWPVRELLKHASTEWTNLPEEVVNEYEKGNVLFLADSIEIITLEGAMRADPTDMVICGVKKELYPCKADIFNSTYENADG